LLQRCALEAAVTVNPAHKTVMFARTLNEEQFIKAELEKNPAFKACGLVCPVSGHMAWACV
jgi:hypothetical protein